MSNPYQSGTYIYLWGGRGGESQGSLRQVHYTIVFLNEVVKVVQRVNSAIR